MTWKLISPGRAALMARGLGLGRGRGRWHHHYHHDHYDDGCDEGDDGWAAGPAAERVHDRV